MFKRTLLAIAFAAAAAHAFAAEQRFELPTGAAVSLTVPAGWKAVQQAAAPQAISVNPEGGKAFHVELTPLVRPDGTWLRTDTETLKGVVEDSAKKVLPQAQEKSLPLQMLFGPNGRGFYFSATDRAPKPGEFKHLTQGVMSVQGLPVAFSIGSNDDRARVEAALEMLRSARRH